jgi:hypothetical protein
MKLEIKHLVPYLPHALKMKVVDTSFYKYDIMTLCDKGGLSNVGLSCVIDEPQYLKPILRPLSDLNKELFINGGFGFIPSKRIVNEYLHTSFWGENEIGMGVLDKERKMINLCFIGNEIVGECPYMIYQNLCEWHFDIFNLIGQGLAVDINTLSVQNDG